MTSALVIVPFAYSIPKDALLPLQQAYEAGANVLVCERQGEVDELGRPYERPLLAGLIFLVLSSRILVWGAVDIARDLGVSDLVIGLTIIAVGTSLPELAASVMSALKKEHDMAIGNIIGSNMFNLLAVMALPGLIAPTSLEPVVLYRDYLVMLALTIALFIMAYGFRAPGRVNRFEGSLLLASFAAYMTWIGVTSLS